MASRSALRQALGLGSVTYNPSPPLFFRRVTIRNETREIQTLLGTVHTHCKHRFVVAECKDPETNFAFHFLLSFCFLSFPDPIPPHAIRAKPNSAIREENNHAALRTSNRE